MNDLEVFLGGECCDRRTDDDGYRDYGFSFSYVSGYAENAGAPVRDTQSQSAEDQSDDQADEADDEFFKA